MICPFLKRYTCDYKNNQEITEELFQECYGNECPFFSKEGKCKRINQSNSIGSLLK